MFLISSWPSRLFAACVLSVFLSICFDSICLDLSVPVSLAALLALCSAGSFSVCFPFFCRKEMKKDVPSAGKTCLTADVPESAHKNSPMMFIYSFIDSYFKAQSFFFLEYCTLTCFGVCVFDVFLFLRRVLMLL